MGLQRVVLEASRARFDRSVPAAEVDACVYTGCDAPEPQIVPSDSTGRRMVKSLEFNIQRFLLGRLERGDDVLRGLTNLCRHNGVEVGYIEALGAVERAGFLSGQTLSGSKPYHK